MSETIELGRLIDITQVRKLRPREFGSLLPQCTCGRSHAQTIGDILKACETIKRPQWGSVIVTHRSSRTKERAVKGKERKILFSGTKHYGPVSLPSVPVKKLHRWGDKAFPNVSPWVFKAVRPEPHSDLQLAMVNPQD